MAARGQRSERFERWVAPMRRRAALWRVVLGTALAAGLWIAAIAAAVTLAEEAGLAPGRGVVVVYLLTFGVLIAGIGAAMRLLHGMPGARLLGPEERLEPRALGRGVLFVGLVAGALFVPMALVEPPERQLGLGIWTLWLVAAVPALLVQATAEEVVFRGYLQGMLAARFASPLVWWVVPALLFGLLHWNPAMGPNAWAMVAVAGAMGLVLGDVAARTGGLSLPIGLHFANNVFAMLVMATPSQLSGLALYLSPLDPGDDAAVRAGLVGNLALILALWVGWLLVRRWRGRRKEG